MASTVGWPIDLLTLSDWDALTFDELHQFECVEGVLIVAPKPAARHQIATVAIVNALNDALPASVHAVIEMDLVLADDPLTVREPDVLVVDRAALEADPTRWRPDEVHLIVEVVSPGSRRQDRVMKYAEYAEAGIAEYWIVDLDEPAIAVHRLDKAGTYRKVAELRGNATHAAFGTEFSLDVDSLATL